MEKIKGRAHIYPASGKVVIAGQEIGVHFKSENGVTSEFSIITQPNDAATAIRVLEAIEKNFDVTSYIDLVRKTSPAIDQSAIQLRERSVADLQHAIQQLGVFQANLAQRESEQRQKLQAELEKAFIDRGNALEKDFRERQSALDKLRADNDADLAQRSRTHDERVARFNTREAQYVRRDLLTTIQTTVSDIEKLVPSKGTGSKRWWIHGFVWVLLIASGTLAVSMGIKAFTKEDWRFLLSCSGGFISFVFTMVYYLKWNDRWFREHADSELSAKRYKADILRASWIAELMSEWAKEGKGDLPADLIAAYTRNLFAGIDPTRVSEHPIDHLTSIMKRATEFDIGKGVFSVRGYRPEINQKPSSGAPY